MTSPSQLDSGATGLETVTVGGSGFEFINTYEASVSAAFRNDIVVAEQYLESHFTNAVTVHVTFGLQSISPDASAENSFDATTVAYSTLVGALQSHATSADDLAAVAALERLSDPSNGAGFSIPIGEARALGLAAAGSENDDTVVLNSLYWSDADFQNYAGDTVGVLEHELTEGIMGRIGGLWAPMDLFRFTASGQRDFTGGQDGQSTYFSTNGSSIYTGLRYHNPINSSGNSDGEDWADWDQVGDDANAHDPFGPGGPGAGDSGTLSPTDLRIMDVLGWTLAGSPSVALPPDLVANTVSLANPSVVAGGSTLISYHIENDGGGAAGASVSKVYLSTDDIITASDTVLATVNDGPVQNGSFLSDSLSITLPNTLAVGTYWVGVIADANGQVSESNEANNASSAVQITIVPRAQMVSPSDFNADGKSDLVWQNDNGAASLWEMDGTSVAAYATLTLNPGPAWHVIGTGDFNGDGFADILWQNDSGAISIWEMNGTGFIANPTLATNPGPSWHVIGTGDFNGDGKSDILWQNDSGAVSIWEMDGTTVLSNPILPVNPGPSWHVIGTGDFNGDGKSDILWQNNNGAVSIWEMNGTNVISNPTLATNPGPSWHVKDAGDFNGDGFSDILWQNDSGAVSIWEMDGTNVITNPTLATNPGPAWHVINDADYNGDGHADIAWQNDNGAASIWEMNGTNVVSNPTLATNPGSLWHVIGPNHGITV